METLDTESMHQPVMPSECLEFLQAGDGGLFVDATLGLGGHTKLILEASHATRVIGIDQDPDALRLATARLAGFGDRFVPVAANFSEIERVVRDAKLGQPQGILADLGVSSLQLDSEGRGFSFRFDAPLDMRMNPESGGETAAELLGRLDQEELANIIYQYGDERASRKIARWIIEKRKAGTPITRTSELADLVKRAVRLGPKEKTHPATRTFQALRIAVNDEIGVIQKFIDAAINVLDDDGVLAIITFHSLEDRVVKQAFARSSGKCHCPPRMPMCVCGAEKRIEILTKKPLVPTAAETEKNSRSKSAKLRACRKIGR
jgi:16S rRNA (cytosine1402-N4)-methyltransferase